MRSNKINNVDLFTQTANDRFKKHVKTQSKEALEIINNKIDWSSLIQPLENEFNRSSTGRKPFNILIIVKCFILQTIYNLSDPRLEEEIADRRSFQIFLGLNSGDSIPDETTICRYRETFSIKELDVLLFKEFYKQLKAKGLVIEQGTLIDATIKPSYTNPKANDNAGNRDKDANFGQKGRKKYFGYKGHIGMDIQSKIIHSTEFTPVSEHDSNKFDDLVTNNELIIMADKGYANEQRKRKYREKGVKYSVLDKAYRNRKLSNKQKRRNKKLSKIRNEVEKPFAFMKNILKNVRCEYYNLKRNRFKFVFCSIIYNMRRMITLTLSTA